MSHVLLVFDSLGAAEEATAVFSEAAALCIQKQYLQNGLATQNLYLPNEDRNLVSSKSAGTEDISPRQLKHMQANNLKDIPGNYHGAAVSAAAASQPLNGGPSNASFYNTPSPITTQVLQQISLCRRSSNIYYYIFALKSCCE